MTKQLENLKKKLKNLLDDIKHHPMRLATILTGLVALVQLAMSQVHIAALVTVKLTVSTPSASNYTDGMPSIGIGMFMFLFILFGLASIFNISRAKSKGKLWVGLGSIFVTIIFGVIFMLKMINPDNYVDYQNVSSSVNWLVSGFVFYGIVAILVIYDIFRNKE